MAKDRIVLLDVFRKAEADGGIDFLKEAAQGFTVHGRGEGSALNQSVEVSVAPMHFSRRRAILLALAALYGSAWLLPPLLMSSGSEGLTPDQQKVADTGRALALTGSWEKWFERLWITHVKAEVLSVGVPQESPADFPSGWVVRVTAHSLFGIPYGQLVFTNEDRLHESVGFPRNASGPLGLLAVAVCTLAAFILWAREAYVPDH